MADFWGPALDAELAYRHERLFTALRGIPLGDDRGGHGPADATDAIAVRTDAAQPVRPRRTAARGWLLRGSGTWHAAR
ncbi:hypothetical protein [uncultured Cellulomonas sp.]|uniref:hypothetical protein n=1 Tax=uncultured Cellulomonas sp. TaxID=189682 RepID=UPI0028EDF0A4|nr:hypothetical protein [uncultured Cellulomonas sp.]